MAHFAKLDEDKKIVVEVLVIDQETLNTGLFGSPDYFVQTSYNTRGGVHYGPDGQPDGGVALRKNYAGIGYIYDHERDAFYAPQPFPSWTLNEETCLWEPPVPMPTDKQIYEWNESTLSWDTVIL